MNPIKQPPPVATTHGAAPQPHFGPVTVAPARHGKLMRLPAVMETVSLGRSSVYAGVRAKTFPAPVRLSARAVAWRSEEIENWVAGRIKTGGQ